MPAPDPIKVEGLREFRKRLRKMNPEVAKGMRLASNAAAQIIVDKAKPKVPIGPGKGGHAVSSIKVASTARAARISAGGKKFPYYAWLDFGGGVGPLKRSRRPFLKSGRYIWAAFEEERDRVEKEMADQLTALAQRAGMEVND